MAGWTLTGQPAGGGRCEHCGRTLAHCYEVTSPEGAAMTVGRGCLKSVTGWTLTAAQAAREIRMIAVRARRAANWAAWSAANPAAAAVIAADCEAFAATHNMAVTGGGAPHEIRSCVQDGERDLSRLVSGYMARRGEFGWAS